MKKMRKNGFTLVELMVVAVIVAILAAVAIPLMSGNKKRAMCSEAEAALGTIRSQLRAQYAETKDYTKSALGGTVAEAQNLAYNLVKRVRWDGVYYRTDIGYRAIARERGQ